MFAAGTSFLLLCMKPIHVCSVEMIFGHGLPDPDCSVASLHSGLSQLFVSQNKLLCILAKPYLLLCSLLDIFFAWWSFICLCFLFLIVFVLDIVIIYFFKRGTVRKGQLYALCRVTSHYSHCLSPISK